MFDLCCYRTRSGLLVMLYKHTPRCKYKYVGYFQVRDVRIKVFYDSVGNEFFGERGLDLMSRGILGNEPPIKER